MESLMYYDQENKNFVEQEDSLSEEDTLLKSFEEEEDIDECAECGGAIREKTVTKEIDEEILKFCGEGCAKDYDESTL